MIALDLPAVQRVALLGAHPDDIEIGAGALVAALARANPDAIFDFVIATGDAVRSDEARQSAERLVQDRATVVVGGFRDGFVPMTDPEGVKDFVRGSVDPIATDLVVAPHVADRHQDHRFIAEVALQVFRDHLVLGYEIAKFDGGLVEPGLYVPFDRDAVTAKIDHLFASFPSQADNGWFDRAAFEALMRLRGIECNSASGYAEAFAPNKLVMGT